MQKRPAFLHISLMMIIGFLTLSGLAMAHSPGEDARVFIIAPADGAVVKSPFKLKFGIEGFGITPAGTTGKRRHTAGHHHLLVDVDQLPSMDEPIPRDAQHIHFDQGETEAELRLSPGKHSLQLLLGDEDHEPQDPPLISKKISITVK